jgi:hypothetical protein
MVRFGVFAVHEAQMAIFQLGRQMFKRAHESAHARRDAADCGGRRMQSVLKPSDYVEFLFRLKFGGGDPLSACSGEAYADLKRTLRDIGKPDVFPRAKEARQQANEVVNLMMASVRDMNAAGQKDFDKWHRGACARLAAIYSKCGYTSFSVGHPQKCRTTNKATNTCAASDDDRGN